MIIICCYNIDNHQITSSLYLNLNALGLCPCCVTEMRSSCTSSLKNVTFWRVRLRFCSKTQTHIHTVYTHCFFLRANIVYACVSVCRQANRKLHDTNDGLRTTLERISRVKMHFNFFYVLGLLVNLMFCHKECGNCI